MRFVIIWFFLTYVIENHLVQDELSRSCHGSVDKTMDSQSWGPGLNLLAAAVVPLGKVLYPHCLVPQKGLKAVGPWLLGLKQLAFLVARLNL